MWGKSRKLVKISTYFPRQSYENNFSCHLSKVFAFAAYINAVRLFIVACHKRLYNLSQIHSFV